VPEGYIPCDVARAYRLDLLYASGIRGSGQRIAIIDAFDNPNAQGNLHAFDTAFGLPDPAFQVVNLGAASGSALGTSWEQEIDLDVQWAHAAAPGAAITLVEAPNDLLDPNHASLLTAVQYAVNVAGADVVSMSWDSGEFSGETALDATFPATNPNGKPVMYVAAAGDAGFGTAWPAVSPAVLGVGGTSLAPSAVGNDTQQPHFDCSRMQTTPGVTSQNETAWGNQSCTSTSCSGTGGGISSMEPKPAWQNNVGLPGGRNVPDVSMLADPASGVALFTGGAWSGFEWGGTSLATLLWAGMIVMLNQQRHAANLPNLNITQNSNWAYQLTPVNDVVGGSAPAHSSDSCISSGTCIAHSGYDLVTGVGSPLGTLTWEQLGGSIISASDAAFQPPSRVDVFAMGPGNALWQRTSNGGTWGSWQSLGGTLTSAPGAVAWSAGRLDVFVRGTDNALWHRWWSGGNWSGWESLGGVLTSAPDVASWSAGRLDVFARGTDNGLWHKWFSGSWSVWESQGGGVASDPSAVSWSVNRIDAFVRGTDSGLWHKWWDGQRWNGWELLGSGLVSGPDASSPATGQLDVFGLDASSALKHKSYSGRWGVWLNLGGPWASDPGAVSQRNGTSDVFEKGTDGQLWHTAIPSPTV
jgi:Repeat of unknown function (DUF346)